MRHKFPDSFVTIGQARLENFYSSHAPHDLLKKLNALIQLQPRYEGDVVYFFILVRKLSELHGLKKVFPTISLICDWIVHSQIDRNSLGFKVLSGIDKELFEKFVVNKNTPYDRKTTKAQELAIEKQLAELWNLRAELKWLFKHYHLTLSFLTTESVWNKFKRLLFNALANSPLTAKNTSDLLFIKSISFTSVWHEEVGRRSRVSDKLFDPPYPRCRILVKDGVVLPGSEHMENEEEQIVEISLKTVDIRDFLNEEEFAELQKSLGNDSS